MSSPYFHDSKTSAYGTIAGFDFSLSITSEDPFLPCPLYTSVKSVGTLKPPLNKTTRHLCSNCCFYKAYSPVRAWHGLRCTIKDAGYDPDELVEKWVCELVEKDHDRTKPGSWTVAFVAPNGEEFGTAKSVCNGLGINLGDEGEGDVKGLQGSGGVKKEGGGGLGTRKRHNAPPDVMVRAELMQSESWRDIDPSSSRNKKIKQVRDMEVKKEGRGSPGVSLWPGKKFIHSPSRESPFGLLEELTWFDPWRLLLTCILLNRTTRRQVDPVLFEFLRNWPDFKTVLKETTEREQIEDCVKPCGMWRKRTGHILRFSMEYSEMHGKGKDMGELEEGDVRGLTCCGDYAWDAYRIFVKGETGGVCKDGALNMYLEWKRGATKVGGRKLDLDGGGDEKEEREGW